MYPQLPSGSASGLVYSFDPRPLEDLGVTSLGTDLAGSYVCETLFFRAVGNCAGFAQFHQAYMSGATFRGIPMDRVIGEPLVATVLRHCPGDAPGVEASSAFQAPPLVPSAMALGSGAEFASTTFPVRSSEPPAGTFAYVQSAAPDGAAVTLSLRAAGSASTWTDCLEVDLFPGETMPVDIAACMDVGTAYAVRATSAGPVALVVEEATQNTLATVEGFYPGGPLDAAGRTVPGPAHRAFGSLVGIGGGAWESTASVHVPGSQPADVTVMWNLLGAPAASQTKRVCGDCFEQFLLGGNLAGAGSVQVEAAGIAGAAAPRIDATLLSRQAGAAPDEAAFSYALAPYSLLGAAGAGGAWGLPNIQRTLTLPPNPDPSSTGVTAVTFLARPEGTGQPVEAALQFFDVNDVMAVDCAAVAAGQRELWIGEISTLPTDFTGAGIVTADTEGDAPMGAVTLLRTGTSGAPIAGDEIAVNMAAGLVSLPGYTAWPTEPCVDFAPPMRPVPLAPPERTVAVRSAVRLPILAFQGWDEVCTATVTVENTGADPMVAILVTWAETSFCPPQCAGPFDIVTSGLIRPGDTWDFEPVAGSASGIVYGAKALTLDEIGAVPGGPELAAQALGAALFVGAMGDCDDMRRFEVAWAGGDKFFAIPLGPLANDAFTLQVARSCPDPEDPRASVENTYDGIASARFDSVGNAPGRRVQSLTPITNEPSRRSLLYVQNAGPRCTTVTLTWHAYGAWEQAIACSIFTIAPGEVYPLDASDCTPRGAAAWVGSVVLESEEPLALIGEIVSPGESRIVAARDHANPYDLDGDLAVNADDVRALDAAMGSEPSGPRWNALADLDANGRVSRDDRQALVDNLDKGVVPPPAPTDETTPTPTATRPAPQGHLIYLPLTPQTRP